MKTLAFVLPVMLAHCATVKDIPITIGVEGNYSTWGYSSVDGLSIKAKIRQEKSGRITPQEIANRWKPEPVNERLP